MNPRHSASYTIATSVYEGPLDLLLSLIERAELDITKLAIAEVTDQYLAHLRLIQDTQASEVSEFIVMAARLLQIKSEVLLPRPPTRGPGEEDPGEALARQLLIYKRFKEMASLLSERENLGLRTYLRIAPLPKMDTLIDLEGISLADLFSAAQSVFNDAEEPQPLGEVITPLRITIRDRIKHISYQLKTFGRVQFSRLLSNRPSPLEIVVTFLAVLELIKRQVVVVQQEEIFGEIFIDISSSWDDSDEFELEFGE